MSIPIEGKRIPRTAGSGVDSPNGPSHAALTSALPGWQSEQPADARPGKSGPCVIGVLPGEGIGPEIMPVVTAVLDVLTCRTRLNFDIRYGGLIGKKSEALYGKALTPAVVAWCESIFSDNGVLLCGPGGGRFVYDLRARFDLFCKFTPVRPYTALNDCGAVRPAVCADVDMVVIRENAGGLYFGECHTDHGPGNAYKVTHAFSYCTEQVRRIMEIGIRLAKNRRRRLTLIVKQGGIPAISRLWIDNFTELTAGENLETSVLDVDNASYQIIAMARQFDVVVAPNLFGDIISDVAALLLGSRGLSYSGNFGAKDIAVYQTGHGAAHDMGGRGIANPIGQIQSAAMMLRESFQLNDAADAIEKAIASTLARGIRTADIASPESKIVGTREMGQYIMEALEGELSRLKIAS